MTTMIQVFSDRELKPGRDKACLLEQCPKLVLLSWTTANGTIYTSLFGAGAGKLSQRL